MTEGMRREGNGEGSKRRITGVEAAGAAAIGALALGAAEVPHAELPEPSAVQATEIDAESREEREELKNWDAFFEFVPVAQDDGNGNITMHWERLFSPGMLGVATESEQPKVVRVSLPYEYARFFNTGEPTSAEDYEMLQSFIARQVLEQTAENISGLSWDKDYYARHMAEAGEGGRVASITIVGETSPEAFRYESVVPGNGELENIELGEHRAIDADIQVRQVLEQLGFTVPEDATRIFGVESQFTTEEFARLEAMALARGKKGSPEELVYQMIADYNKGKIDDPMVQTELDELVGSKRKVEVEIQMADGTKKAYLIPGFLPALLLLGLAGRRRDTGEPQPEPAPGPEPRPRIVDVAVPPDRHDRELVNDVAVDLFHNLSFYLPLVERYRGAPEVDTNEMTHDLLALWTEHDNRLREKMGQPPEDQAKRPRQVFYADLHAVALRRLMLDARERNADESRMFGEQATRDAMARDMREEVERLHSLEAKK